MRNITFIFCPREMKLNTKHIQEEQSNRYIPTMDEGVIIIKIK